MEQSKLAAAVDWRKHLRTEPFKHQVTAAEFICSKPNWALIMEMGTGKTLSLILASLHLKSEGLIDGLLLICPKPLMDNELAEFMKHSKDPDSCTVFLCRGSKRFDQIAGWVHDMHSHRLSVLVVNYDLLLNEGLASKIAEAMEQFKVMAVCDESTRIKNNNSQRSKESCWLGQKASRRGIMTGSPITERPTDAWGQFRFLDHRPISYTDPDVGIFGNSWWAFRNFYCVMGGYGNHQVVSYKNIDQFKQRLLRHSFRVEKKDCLDLPAKVYEVRKFDMPPEMAQVYDSMAQELFWADQDGEEFEATIALTKFQRLKEITSGYVRQGDRVRPLKKNPKLEELVEVLEESSAQKAIVWCRERPEIEMVSRGVEGAFKGADRREVFQLHGGVKDKHALVEAFKAYPGKAVLVGQVQTGGMGFTIVEATLVVYMSNDFSQEIRVQSEDRCHRAGQKNVVTYVDLVAKKSVDEYTMKVLTGKQRMAASLTDCREAVYFGKEHQPTWEETEF